MMLKNREKRNCHGIKLIAFSSAICAVSTPTFAQSLELSPSIKAGYSTRDIVHRPGNSAVESDAFFLEARLLAQASLSSKWSLGLDTRAQLASEELTLTDEAVDPINSSEDENFVELRQFWLSYSGLTDYPNEQVNIGLARIRAAEGIWWDVNLESLFWQGNTTTFDWLIGVGQQFDIYRKDADLNVQNEGVLRVFGEFKYDWQAYHQATFRVLYSDQSSNEVALDEFRDFSRGANGDWLWLGIGLDSDWNENRSPSPWAYRFEYIYQTGDADFLESANTLVTKDIDAYAIDAGFRYDFSQGSIGSTFSLASGGSDEGETNNFSQSGIHTNRSRYMGNRQFMFRFNEALRADFTNLQQMSVFATYNYSRNFELAAAVSTITLDDESEALYVGGRALDTVGGQDDIGTGFDLSMSYYGANLSTLPINFVRLRASTFDPGDALANDDSDYRITFEIQVKL